MNFLRTLIFALALTFAFPAISMAETFEHAESGVQFESPNGWQSQVEEGALIIAPKDGSIALVFDVIDAKDLDMALEVLEKELSSQFTNIKVKGDAETAKINGMMAVAVEADAKLEGAPVKLGLMLMETKSGKVLLALSFGEPKSMTKYESELVKILMSIKSK